jgi:hypothetical protein
MERFIHDLYAKLYPNTKENHHMITFAQELAGIQTAVNALIAEDANPTQTVLTAADQTAFDALATSLNAPTSASTVAAAPVSTGTAAPVAAS